MLTRERIVTVRKTPGAEQPFDPSRVRELCDVHRRRAGPGDDRVPPRRRDRRAVPRPARRPQRGDRRAGGARRRAGRPRRPAGASRASGTTCSTSGRRSRRRETPCARSWTAGSSSRAGHRSSREVFPHEIERQFATTYDKLLRATEAIEYARDLARSRPRLPAGADLDRPERGHEAAHGHRLDPPRPDLHRRALRAELQAHARAPLGLRLLVVVGLDSRHTVFQVVFYRRKGWI